MFNLIVSLFKVCLRQWSPRFSSIPGDSFSIDWCVREEVLYELCQGDVIRLYESFERLAFLGSCLSQSVRLCFQERLTYGVARSYAEGHIAVEASQIAFMMIDDSYWTC